MSSTEPTPPDTTSPASVEFPTSEEKYHEYRDMAFTLAVSWLVFSLALDTPGLPLRFLLKDRLSLEPEAVAVFFAIGNFASYIKPFAGVLCDSIPLFGTRRRHYLGLSLFAAALLIALIGVIPRNYALLLGIYSALLVVITVTSTSLGGLMVETGHRFRATGRLSAQRIGITRSVGLATGPIGGFLVGLPFLVTTATSALLYGGLGMFLIWRIDEPGGARCDREALRTAGEQFRTLLRSRTLWYAAGLVCLVVIAPGFGTPLFYYQTNTLHFSALFIGSLSIINSIGCIVAAIIYSRVCRYFTLRQSLAVSIVIHAAGTLFYLAYRSPSSALAITALEGVAQTLAVLPLYDLAARATPRGSEALGYSVMMSVWNLTIALSDMLGSYLYGHFGMTFRNLVWLNAGTTILVLLAVPFLPRALMERRDGDPQPGHP